MIRFEILQNDPYGDEGHYGSFIAWILWILRVAWCVTLGIGMLAFGLAILVGGGMVIKLILMGLSLFITDIPFEHRL